MYMEDLDGSGQNLNLNILWNGTCPTNCLQSHSKYLVATHMGSDFSLGQ